MENVRTIYLDWNTGGIVRSDSGAYLARQYDHLSNLVVIRNAPGLENYYLIVEMKEDEDDLAARSMEPILLSGPYWLVPNVYTQLVQPVTFQVCCKTESGDFEQHSAKFKLNVVESLDHDGSAVDVDPSPMFDAYKNYVDQRVDNLIIAAGDVVIDPTLSVSGAAADAKATGDAISETNERLDNYEDIFTGDVGESVANWLDEHPEATTTVQDGSITEQKIATAYRKKISKSYDNVSAMVADTGIQNGMYVMTKGYADALDGGDSVYSIIDSEVTGDGGKYISLANGLVAVCISKSVPYPTYIKTDKTAKLYNLSDNSDISTLLNTVLSLNGIDIVSVPAGSFTIGSTVTVPDGKTLCFEGDYNNPSITPTQISPVGTGYSMIVLGNGSHIIGGVFNLGSNENVVCIEVPCYNKAIVRSDVFKTKIVGGRESSPHVFTQTAVFVNCDYPDGETVTNYGYLMYCEFDVYITGVGSAYHFKRLTSPASTSGVWLTQNDIHGYIHHCTHYIWYDFVDGGWANNDSVIDATLQSGSLYSGEGTYPGVNLWGSGVLVTGKFWDFTGARAKPAVHFEQGATENIVLRRCSVTGYDLANGATVQNLSNLMMIRRNNFKKIRVSLKSTETFDASEYVDSLQNYSYLEGNTIYFNISFKILQNIPSGSKLFEVVAEAFITSYILDIFESGTGVEKGKAFVAQASPHGIKLTTDVTRTNVWVSARGVFVLDRITSTIY